MVIDYSKMNGESLPLSLAIRKMLSYLSNNFMYFSYIYIYISFMNIIPIDLLMNSLFFIQLKKKNCCSNVVIV